MRVFEKALIGGVAGCALMVAGAETGVFGVPPHSAEKTIRIAAPVGSIATENSVVINACVLRTAPHESKRPTTPTSTQLDVLVGIVGAGLAQQAAQK
jgi:hypothetical protein